jgi:hypothetical protein
VWQVFSRKFMALEAPSFLGELAGDGLVSGFVAGWQSI